MRMGLFVITLCIFTDSAIAQKNYQVIYRHYYNLSTSEPVGTSNSFNRNEFLFLNKDSLSFYIYSDYQTKILDNKVGGKNKHHAIYSFLWLNRYLTENAWKKPFRLKEQVHTSFNWILQSDTKIICGFICKKAISGSITAWYSEKHPANAGPADYSGLPGLILQIEDDSRKWLITANTIINEAPEIELPKMKIEECMQCESKMNQIITYLRL